jgi:type IV pilus biogenesis protein CpaD/CtpE
VPKKTVLIVVAAALLGGCAGFPQQSSAPQVIPGVWLRTDGQSGKDNPVLAQQFTVDKAACTAPGSVEPDRNCMSQRGYILVPENQAAAKAAELRTMIANADR